MPTAAVSGCAWMVGDRRPRSPRPAQGLWPRPRCPVPQSTAGLRARSAQPADSDGPDAWTVDAAGGHRQPQAPARRTAATTAASCRPCGNATLDSRQQHRPPPPPMSDQERDRKGWQRPARLPDRQIRSQPSPVPARPPDPFASPLVLVNGHLAGPIRACVPAHHGWHGRNVVAVSGRCRQTGRLVTGRSPDALRPRAPDSWSGALRPNTRRPALRLMATLGGRRRLGGSYVSCGGRKRPSTCSNTTQMSPGCSQKKLLPNSVLRWDEAPSAAECPKK
jgi:hypothetical protein